MSLSMVILAAGRGSRFGGDKPLAEVGTEGQSLFEYSVHDAVQSGFKQVVFVVNEEQDTSVFKHRLDNYGDHLQVDFAVQSLETGTKSSAIDITNLARVKPWGTGHAVLACQELIYNPFIVINADDYYGRENFQRIGQYLLDHANNPKTCALPGYHLNNTLSLSGSVNRGICRVDSDGYLVSIAEIKGITQDTSGLYSANDVKHDSLADESIVSMTFWGFQPSIFEVLNTGFKSFLSESRDLVESEFYIPDAIDRAVKTGALKVRVFPTSEKWKGLTYAADIDEVRSFIASLAVQGDYAELHSPQR